MICLKIWRCYLPQLQIWRHKMRKIYKLLILFIIGGCIYTLMEFLWRGYSHPAMIIVGGVCFLAIGSINEIIPWEMPLFLQSIIGGIIITTVELISGCILNLWLNLGIWDYSNMPFNFKGQICLAFSVLWCFISTFGIILDDFLRWKLFGEDKPFYFIS